MPTIEIHFNPSTFLSDGSDDEMIPPQVQQQEQQEQPRQEQPRQEQQQQSRPRSRSGQTHDSMEASDSFGDRHDSFGSDEGSGEDDRHGDARGSDRGDGGRQPPSQPHHGLTCAKKIAPDLTPHHGRFGGGARGGGRTRTRTKEISDLTHDNNLFGGSVVYDGLYGGGGGGGGQDGQTLATGESTVPASLLGVDGGRGGHRRRASHPLPRLTRTDIERGLEAVRQLRGLDEEREEGGGEGDGNSKSVRFHQGQPHEVKFDNESDDDDGRNEEWQGSGPARECKQIQKAAKKPKALNERSRREYTFVLCAGFCLAFNSGYINGACLSGLLCPNGNRVSVSAFTGSYTKSALQLAAGDTADAGFLVSMILCFIGGAFLAALINPRAQPYQLGPQYGPTFLLGSVFLILSSVLSETRPNGLGLFYFAAAANGLQNGMSSMYSGNLIRSSHYTGISTDMGLILGQVVRGNRTSLWKLWVLMGLTVSFWTGGYVSFHATSHFRTHSLIFNATFFFFIGVGLIVFVAFLNHVTLWQAAFGTWQWQRALDSLVTVHSMRDSFPLGESEEVSENFLVNLFDRIDKDESGDICEDELYSALEAAGMKVSRKGIKAMMKLADEDGDGRIGKDEWRTLVTGKVEVSRRGSMMLDAAEEVRRDYDGDGDGDGDVESGFKGKRDLRRGLTM